MKIFLVWITEIPNESDVLLGAFKSKEACEEYINHDYLKSSHFKEQYSIEEIYVFESGDIV